MNCSKQPDFNKSGIYSISSKIKPERVYIGSSHKFRVRRNKHFLDLKKNIHCSPKLQRHYNKYGVEDLVFTIIEFCKISQLIERENYYIKLLHPYFNCNPNASSRAGAFVSEETRQKQREKKLGHIPWNKGLSGYKIEKKIKSSDESKKKISEGLKKFFQEHPEAREHLSNLWKGKPPSPSTIKRGIETNQKPVEQYSMSGVFIKEWCSVRTACIGVGISWRSIHKVLVNKSPYSKGFIFKYKNNDCN